MRIIVRSGWRWRRIINHPRWMGMGIKLMGHQSQSNCSKSNSSTCPHMALLGTRLGWLSGEEGDQGQN
jgi:hypothetical protein